MGSFSIWHWLIVLGIAWFVWRAFRRGRPSGGDHTNKSSDSFTVPMKVTISYDDGRGARSSGRTPDAGDGQDAWEGSFWEIGTPQRVAAALQFDYTDGAGSRTTRKVDVRQFGPWGDALLVIGHCRLRDATRTFRTDRMRNCVDLDTGELIDDVAAFLRERHARSPEAAGKRLVDAEYDTLRVLYYVGKADGQLRAAEKAIIRATASALVADSTLTDAAIDRVLAEMDLPTIRAFKLAVGRLASRDAPAREAVLRATEQMIATQKTVHPSEREALDYMRQRFAAARAN